MAATPVVTLIANTTRPNITAIAVSTIRVPI